MVVIFSVVQLETSFIFFSASDKSLAQWHTPKNLHRNRGPGKPVGIMVNPVVEFLFFKDQNGQRCISCLLVLKVSKFRKQKYLFLILPKNQRNIYQNLTYLLGQKFFFCFLGEL